MNKLNILKNQQVSGRRPVGRKSKTKLAVLILCSVLGVAFLALETWGWILSNRTWNGPAPALAESAEAPEKRVKSLTKANQSLERKLKALAPKGSYIVVDTAGNRVYLRQGEETLREMLASCGSGNVLEDPVGGRKWTFDTPRGQFQVRSKVTNPIWIKPDWAFIEEGEPVPSKTSDRAEPGMMGDYALGIGQGYFLHGTLYKRLLGRNVSHGCIRLGDDDLELLYKTIPLGTRVIIF